MNKAKYVFRIVFFLVAVVLLVYLNGKTDDNTATIAEFKFKMFKKMQTDSLDSKHKLELLVNETTKFVDDSSRVRKGIHYLTGLFTLLVVVEFGFLIMGKRNYGRQEAE
jgi:serine kinase of HPr protein (carbohydrate metabolism regulator)